MPCVREYTLVVRVGLCGDDTTCSAFSLQTLDLIRGGAIVRSGINIVASVALCVGAFALGHFVAVHFKDGVAQIAQMLIEEEG